MKKLLMITLVAVATLMSGNAMAQRVPTQPSSLENPNMADIVFETETHDFGVIPQSIPATYTYIVKNKGKEPLIITNVTAGCGCTTPDWTKEPIKPGGKGFVKATYNAASPGVFNKTVTVTSNGKKASVTLYLKGEVKSSESPK